MWKRKNPISLAEIMAIRFVHLGYDINAIRPPDSVSVGDKSVPGVYALIKVSETIRRLDDAVIKMIAESELKREMECQKEDTSPDETGTSSTG